MPDADLFNPVTNKVSLDAVANSLLPAEDETPETVVDEAPVDTVEAADDTTEDVTDDITEDTLPLEGEADEEISAGDDTITEDESVAAPAAHDDQDYLDITDEDLIEVKVDGEVVYRSVAEAKAALSGEGAIQRRLEEATKERQTAQQDRMSGIRELESRRDQLRNVIEQLDTHLFQPTVTAPPNELRHQDPNAYLNALDAYQADQARIADSRKRLKDGMATQQQQQQQNFAAMRQMNEQELVRKIPALGDPNKVTGIMNDIVSVGRSYGFDDTEIASLFDHRSFFMAHELSEARKEIARLTGTVKVSKKAVAKPGIPRRLRSGVAKKQAESRAKSKARKQVHERAKRTGKVDDVVSTLMQRSR